ncbi:hypothetical protein NUACC21_09030 [Scytonema sp. NUACC21]
MSQNQNSQAAGKTPTSDAKKALNQPKLIYPSISKITVKGDELNQKKKVFLAIVLITLSIVSYNSTSFGTYSMLDTQVDAIINSTVEKEGVYELENSQSSQLENDKSVKDQELEKEKKQALFSEAWDKVNSQYKFKFWMEMGIVNSLYLTCLTLYFLNKFLDLSNFLIRLNWVIIGVVAILGIILIRFKLSIVETIFSAVFFSFVSTIHIYPFIEKLIKSMSNAKKIFNEEKESKILFSTIIIGIFFGVGLSLFINSQQVAIALNCIAIFALLMLHLLYK